MTVLASACAAETSDDFLAEGSSASSDASSFYDIYVVSVSTSDDLGWDSLSWPDPMVEIAMQDTCGQLGAMGRTTTVTDTLEPYWHEEVLSSIDLPFYEEPFHVFVWDEDYPEVGDLNDLLAHCEVDLVVGLNHRQCEEWSIEIEVRRADDRRVPLARPDSYWWEVVTQQFEESDYSRGPCE